MRARTLVAATLATVLAGAAAAQSVALQGMMGSRALLLVDGAPKTMAPGETFQGVRLLSAQGEEAVVEIEGRKLALRLGAAPASLGGGAAPRGDRIVLTAGTGGHFMTLGTINGRSVQFIVDTGATSVAMSASLAERLGIDYKSGRPSRSSTANGIVQTWLVKARSVRVGDVELYDVDAVVLPAEMPYVLLGNSFLSRFQMKRENDQMVLERRF